MSTLMKLKSRLGIILLNFTGITFVINLIMLIPLIFFSWIRLRDSLF